MAKESADLKKKINMISGMTTKKQVLWAPKFNTISDDLPTGLWIRRMVLDKTGLTMDVPDATLSAEQAILRRERLAAIRQRVQALPERQRLAVLMHKYQQMDYKQIGEVLKLSESATKSLLFRAYETLREQLKEFV